MIVCLFLMIFVVGKGMCMVLLIDVMLKFLIWVGG